MNKNLILLVVVGIPLLIVAFAVAYYFVVLLPQSNYQENLAKNQASCVQMGSKILAEEQQRHDLEIVSATNHYNLKLNKCFVEIEVNYPSTSNEIIDVTIYDAMEGNPLIGCGGVANALKCNDSRVIDRTTYSQGSGPKITQAQFTSLEKQYMTE